jgi:hypothetical protein
MHKILPAIALCLALHPAFAGDAASTAQASGTVPAGGLMHATLVVPAQSVPTKRAGEAAARTNDLQPGSQRQNGQQERSPTTGMLLAALALMLGIALRRWGGSQQ